MSGVRLDRKLVLEKRVQVGDGAGGFSTVWQALGSVWGEIRPGSGREVGGEEVSLSSVPLRVTVRAAPASNPRRPMPGQRFREGNRTFSILAVTERGDLYLTCFAREEVPT